MGELVEPAADRPGCGAPVPTRPRAVSTDSDVTFVHMRDEPEKAGCRMRFAECQAAEAAGFAGVSVGERRIGVTAYCTTPGVLAGLALANTSRIDFTPMVIQLPLRHPIDVIQEACVLDSVYPGRYRLGVGAGVQPFGGTGEQP